MKEKKLLLLILIAAAAVSLYASLRYRTDLSRVAAVQAQLSELESKAESFRQISDSDNGALSDINMDIADIDGRKYAGIISFPDTGLALPVLYGGNSEHAAPFPVLSSGSVKLNDLVISVDSRGNLLEPLEDLSRGSYASFTDISGNVSYYQINEIQQAEALHSDKIKSGGWALTFIVRYPGDTACTAFRCAAAV